MKIFLSLEYCKLSTDENESAEVWMDHLRIKANECNYKECVRQLKEQFINGINDEIMTAEIMKELTTIGKISDITSEQVLSKAKRVEARRDQKVMLSSIRTNFDMVRHMRHYNENIRNLQNILYVFWHSTWAKKLASLW